MTGTDSKTKSGRVIVIVLALAVIMGAFAVFLTMNTERINAQNAQYLQGSTQQSARRISEWMTDSQTEVKLLSSMYERGLTRAEDASIEGIKVLAETTKFD